MSAAGLVLILALCLSIYGQVRASFPPWPPATPRPPRLAGPSAHHHAGRCARSSLRPGAAAAAAPSALPAAWGGGGSVGRPSGPLSRAHTPPPRPARRAQASFQTPAPLGVKTLSGRSIKRDSLQSAEGWVPSADPRRQRHARPPARPPKHACPSKQRPPARAWTCLHRLACTGRRDPLPLPPSLPPTTPPHAHRTPPSPRHPCSPAAGPASLPAGPWAVCPAWHGPTS
jgi:hypothetical protein